MCRVECRGRPALYLVTDSGQNRARASQLVHALAWSWAGAGQDRERRVAVAKHCPAYLLAPEATLGQRGRSEERPSRSKCRWSPRKGAGVLCSWIFFHVGNAVRNGEDVWSSRERIPSYSNRPDCEAWRIPLRKGLSGYVEPPGTVACRSNRFVFLG